ncbi:hypothetical protein B0T13DRAFT_446421 [Neurospora crassa]|nr:hypothetical protein B0T13DRAFT_446421 [Neurospora crassa]
MAERSKALCSGFLSIAVRKGLRTPAKHIRKHNNILSQINNHTNGNSPDKAHKAFMGYDSPIETGTSQIFLLGQSTTFMNKPVTFQAKYSNPSRLLLEVSRQYSSTTVVDGLSFPRSPSRPRASTPSFCFRKCIRPLVRGLPTHWKITRLEQQGEYYPLTMLASGLSFLGRRPSAVLAYDQNEPATVHLKNQPKDYHPPFPSSTPTGPTYESNHRSMEHFGNNSSAGRST